MAYLVCYIFGVLLSTIGALFKIMHWPYGLTILTIGTILSVGYIILGLREIYSCDYLEAVWICVKNNTMGVKR